MLVKRGEIYYADLSPVVGSELLEQVRTIDKRRLKERMGALDGQDMGKVDHAISVSFGL